MHWVLAHFTKRVAVAAGFAAAGLFFLATETPAAGQGSAVERLQAELPEHKLPALGAVLRAGLLNGPDIIMSEWHAAAAREEVTLGRSPMLPSASVWARPGVIYEQNRDRGSDRTMMAVLYNVGFYQPLYQWGALEKGYEIARIRNAMAARNVAETRRVLALDLRRRFFDFALAANELGLARERLARMERDREDLRRSIDDGFAAPVAMEAPNRNIDMQRPEVARWENECAALRASLVQITGLPEAEIDRLPAEIPAPGEIGGALDALSGSIVAPPSAREAQVEDQARIEKLNYEIAKKRLYPRLGVELSVTQDDRRAAGDATGDKSLITSWNALLAVNWTLFDGFASQATQRAALARMRALETGRAQIARQEGEARRAATARIKIAWERLQNSERDLARARGDVAFSERDFAAGVGTRRNVDDSRASFSETLKNAGRARADFYVELASWLSSRGQDPALENFPGH